MSHPPSKPVESNQKTSSKSVNRIRIFISFLNLVTTFVFLDFVSKYAALNFLSQSLVIFPGAQFQLEKNTGIAFSIAIPQDILVPLTLLVFFSIIIFLIKTTDLSKKLALFIISLMASGALGNLFDRLYHGFVVDFISIGNFPVFNLADSYITVSVFLLLLFYDRIKRSN